MLIKKKSQHFLNVNLQKKLQLRFFFICFCCRSANFEFESKKKKTGMKTNDGCCKKCTQDFFAIIHTWTVTNNLELFFALDRYVEKENNTPIARGKNITKKLKKKVFVQKTSFEILRWKIRKKLGRKALKFSSD